MKNKKIAVFSKGREATKKERIELAKWTIGIENIPEIYGKAVAFLPTHGYNYIKEYRNRTFYTCVQAKFLNERRVKLVTTTSEDLEKLRIYWLQEELKRYTELIDTIPSMSSSDIIETKKYMKDLTEELDHPGILDKKQIDENLWEGLFRNKDDAREVKKIFEISGCTKNGIYQGVAIKKDKRELLAAYFILIPLLKKGDHTKQAVIFYNEFGLKVGPKKEGGYISRRWLQEEPVNTPSYREFEYIFHNLLNKKK
jgi:hypothetical protein